MRRIIGHIRKARAAFTLMEVNLAIFVMAVGVLAMTSLYPLGFRESEQSRDDVYAAVIADEVLGKLTAARAFSRCDYIEEGYPTAEAWNALLDGAAQALGKTREEIDAFLDAIPTEG